MIYFTTKAYNAEKTLPRAIESVLSQTYGDFIYHLCDNGSTDGTGDIIRDYAGRDSRIKPFFNEKNQLWTIESERAVLNLSRYLNNDDYFSVLDADDDYSPDFLEKMLSFAEQNDLDYVCCRSDFIDESTGKCKNEVVLSDNILMCDEGFGTLFPDYFRFMGARWGKLQKGSMLNRINWQDFDRYISELNLSHRGDTASMLYYLRYSERAGVLAELLHNYRLYPVSHSNQNIDSKINDNYKMPEIYRDFLKAKVGRVTPENERFIIEVFERSMRRTLEQKENYNGKR